MYDHQAHGKNLKGRDFVCGDLHGSRAKLEEKLKKVKFDRKKDRLFSVGDLIDRGDDSIGCLKLLNEPWFYAVMGNHEEMMVKGVIDGCQMNYSCWLGNGGNWSIECTSGELIFYAETLSRLPIAITVATDNGNVGIIHARPPISRDWNDVMDLNDSTRDICIWKHVDKRLKDFPITENIAFTVHGHTPLYDPKHMGNGYWIDTGACFHNGYVTLLEIQPEIKIH